ncbi:MAG: hypothetical protein ACFFB2_09290 [Promethearchaeota archaeon]
MKPKKTLQLLVFIGFLGISMISQTGANYGEVRTIAVIPGMDPGWFPAFIHNPSQQAAFQRVFGDYEERMITFWTVPPFGPGLFDSQEALGYAFGWFVIAENQQEATQVRDVYDSLFYLQKNGETFWTLISDDKTPVVRMPALTEYLREIEWIPTDWEIYSYREGGAFKPNTLSPGQYMIRIDFYTLGEFDGSEVLEFNIY